jgi:hypothetical protein
VSVERQAARFLVDVADAISKITSGKTDYGEFYVSEVRIGYDGDDTGYRVIPNEHGDYDIDERKPEK